MTLREEMNLDLPQIADEPVFVDKTKDFGWRGGTYRGIYKTAIYGMHFDEMGNRQTFSQTILVLPDQFPDGNVPQRGDIIIANGVDRLLTKVSYTIAGNVSLRLHDIHV